MRLVPQLLLGLLLLSACGAAEPERPADAPAPAAATEPAPEAAPFLGLPGFVVWESNRSGAWRLWIRDLDGAAPWQLTADEPGRRHCCAHVAPGGDWITYLSLPDGKQVYSAGDVSGPLRLIRPDGSEERELAPAARTYFEHRAAVWRDAGELIYIDDRGRTVLADLDGGEPELLTSAELPEYGSLIDSRLSWATNGRAEFATYDRDRHQLALRWAKEGCQPYFSHDGRWGFWTAGVGGPIHRIELATGRVEPILHKSDRRLPPDRGYLYFPMLSRDGSLFAFAASPDEHDHFRADYDIFVGEVHPETLEPLADPVRMTHHPATDRFPDVYLEPLELGRRSGEAPLAAEWRSPDGAEWRWDFGDGSSGRGARVEHAFLRPGRYEVTATRGDARLRGRVTVDPARGPRALAAGSRDEGRRVEVEFDEPVAPAAPVLRFESGAAVRRFELTADGRRLEIELEQPLAGGDVLHLEGFVDRAQRPNPMEPATLVIEPPLWPGTRDGLAFVWAHAAAPNLVFDEELGAERATQVEPNGRAIFDHHFTMVLGRGTFTASTEDSQAILRATRGTNRLTLEAFVTPGATGTLLRVAGFALSASSGGLLFTLRTGVRGPEAFQHTDVAAWEPGRPLHLAVTYAPGRLAAYVDGESAGEWPLSGDFFHWRHQPLVFGEGTTAADGAEPRLEGVAVYGRVLSPAEVRENFLRYRAARAARPAVASAEVEARLERRSRVPSLDEISPYREALVVEEWRVTSVPSGEHPAGPTRVARWAILDGETEPPLDPGASRRLTLERFEDNPQLEGVFVSDDLGPGGGDLYYAVE